MKFSRLSTTILFILLSNLPLILFGQTDSIQLVIDQQIWLPFQKSYQNYDHQTFNDLHSDDLLRISSKKIRLAKEYKEKNTEWFTKAKKEGYQQAIEFRFEKRIVTRDLAYETGYYKIDSQKPDGTQRTHFARFQVALQKIEGIWKITQDWDSNEINGKKVGAEDFYRMAPAGEDLTSIVTIDFVKILNNRKAETVFYYEKNWKVLREQAIKKGYIRSFQLLINESPEEEAYDILLITEYGDQNQFDLKETHFGELIANQDGLQLKNELQPADFRKVIKDMTLTSRR